MTSAKLGYWTLLRCSEISLVLRTVTHCTRVRISTTLSYFPTPGSNPAFLLRRGDPIDSCQWIIGKSMQTYKPTSTSPGVPSQDPRFPKFCLGTDATQLADRTTSTPEWKRECSRGRNSEKKRYHTHIIVRGRGKRGDMRAGAQSDGLLTLKQTRRNKGQKRRTVYVGDAR
ncbi:hypothetical protein BDM02DRAFT_499218 [Thelephora ganbajun]|uniref:Uncharacterized protein n=1 Tax=Thelephora ganbajun TaxID=370292 RepID=A0ACB6Z7P3_THEGA|nr:hypothetical protein BDM02DRAFT_499218 [Thelephora ganbajun]